MSKTSWLVYFCYWSGKGVIKIKLKDFFELFRYLVILSIDFAHAYLDLKNLVVLNILGMTQLEHK